MRVLALVLMLCCWSLTATAAELMLPTLELTPTRHAATQAGYGMHVGFFLRGPVPAGSEAVATFMRGGKVWSTLRAPLEPRADERLQWVSLDGVGDQDQTREVGKTTFTIALVSQGSSSELISGQVEIVGSGDALMVASDWLLDAALVGLDTDYSQTVPRLRAALWVRGPATTFSATLTRDGVPVATSDVLGQVNIDASQTLATLGGEAAYTRVDVMFPLVVGWAFGADGGMKWHRLDRQPGRYELVLAQKGKAVRRLTFMVVDGRIVAQGALMSDGRRSWINMPVALLDEAKKPSGGPYWGSGVDPWKVTSLDALYQLLDR